MNRFANVWLVVVWLATGLGLPAQGNKTEVRLVLSHESARAGDEIMAGVQLKMPPGWHTYWRNPGGPGLPTKIAWTLPDGVTAGEIQWPVPERYTLADVISLVYHDEAILLVPLKVASAMAPGKIQIKAKVDWLECFELCTPGQAEVSAALIVGPEAKPSRDTKLLDAARGRLPKDGADRGALAGWEKSATGDSRPLLVEWNLADPASTIDFYPYRHSDFEVGLATETLPKGGGKARLRKQVTNSEVSWPKKIDGLLIEKGTGKNVAAFEVSLPVSDGDDISGASSSSRASGAAAASTIAPPSLPKMLWFGFLGGLILNIMPCVFPVIALKILGFVNQSKEASGEVLKLGLLYALGVVASFMTLAAMVIAVRSTGGAASWGMQMQSPQFTVALTTLVTLVALNLFGLFEVNLGGRAMGAAGSLAAKEGAGGAFFNGVLATVLATPCTAPFLAPALGFAFAQPPVGIVLMFLAVAIGLSFPYVILSWRPEWLKFLPRPGAWMEKFKVAMGFPMLATAIWLFSFTARRFGTDGPLWLGLFLVIVAMAAWIWGEFVQRGSKRRGLAMAISLFFFAAGYVYALEGELHWRSPVKHAASSGSLQTSPDGIEWQAWSPQALIKARAEGVPVLVDFTADWCLTCKLNKRSSIEIASVRAKLKAIKGVALLGDFTDQDPVIAKELERFGRNAVPLVLVYPKSGSAPPIVLPPLLTPALVLAALEQATK